ASLRPRKKRAPVLMAFHEGRLSTTKEEEGDDVLQYLALNAAGKVQRRASIVLPDYELCNDDSAATLQKLRTIARKGN
ncbi:MAG: hypothetical protein MK179_22945, partial [Pirellulaceae bacterium]|nr:hypothetical protein [Pirellulaceae bacterium]